MALHLTIPLSPFLSVAALVRVQLGPAEDEHVPDLQPRPNRAAPLQKLLPGRDELLPRQPHRDPGAVGQARR